jgi:hypothetical protein
VEVHGHAKQGAGVRLQQSPWPQRAAGHAAHQRECPVVAQRLRKGARNSSRGAKRLVGDAVKQVRRLLDPKARVVNGGTGDLILPAS